MSSLRIKRDKIDYLDSKSKATSAKKVAPRNYTIPRHTALPADGDALMRTIIAWTLLIGLLVLLAIALYACVVSR